MIPRGTRLAVLLSASVLILATAAVYWPGLYGGFIFDDYPNLVDDPDWKVTSLSIQEWVRAISHGFAGLGGRPIAMLTFAGNHYLTGLDPFALKLTNLLIHLANGMLALIVCRLLFSSVRNGPQPGTLAAFIVTAGWMLHPIQVSTVLYVVQRMELGAQTGVLLALAAYLIGRRRQISGHSGWGWIAAACAATAFSLGFKENALIVPAYTLLFELTILRFRTARRNSSAALMTSYALAGVLAVSATLWLIPHFIHSPGYETRHFTWVERLLTQLPVLTMYLKQTLWPLPESLFFYYDNFPVSHDLFSPPATAWAGLALLGLIIVAVASWRRWPLTTLGIGWFFVAHSITSSVVPLELAFEHRNYLASLGVLIAIVQPALLLFRKSSPHARIVIAIVPVFGLAVLCAVQSASWGNTMQLAVTLASRNPESARANYELGRLLLHQAGSDTSSPQWSLARRQFEHAARLPNSSPLAEQALIMMESQTGQITPRETWSTLRLKLSRQGAGPQEINALYALSECRIQQFCVLDDKELFDTFIVALQRNPTSPVLHVMYGNFAWNVIGDQDLAIRMLRIATELRPQHIGYKVGLAKFLLASQSKANWLESRSLIDTIHAANNDGRFDDDLAELASLRDGTLHSVPAPSD